MSFPDVEEWDAQRRARLKPAGLSWLQIFMLGPLPLLTGYLLGWSAGHAPSPWLPAAAAASALMYMLAQYFRLMGDRLHGWSEAIGYLAELALKEGKP